MEISDSEVLGRGSGNNSKDVGRLPIISPRKTRSGRLRK
jgi:hypothetical protein